MADSYFTGARAERYQEMVREGDWAGVRRMKFGEILYNARRLKSPEFSQGLAAEIAGLTRVQWNRIENGVDRPRPSSILGIAKALDISTAILLRAAGYRVPDEHVHNDRTKAHKWLDDALDESVSEEEFLLYMLLVWVQEQLHMMGTLTETSRLPEKITFTPGRVKLLASMLKHLSMIERVQLAMELVESSEHHAVEQVAGDLGRFYEFVANRLEELRYPMLLNDEDFIL
jgi:transcriptional regulator with XRE-family HTH domain